MVYIRNLIQEIHVTLALLDNQARYSIQNITIFYLRLKFEFHL